MIPRQLGNRAITLFVLVFVAVGIYGCGGSNPFMPTWPAEALLPASEESEVQGRLYVLETSLWRDFMPFSPPDGKPLIALVRVRTKDSTELPPELDIAWVWVINGKQVWETKFSGQATRPNSFTLERVARNGPKWGPNVEVDVVVGLVYKPSRRIYLLKAPNQLIFRTD